jgi:hypothetical protein
MLFSLKLKIATIIFIIGVVYSIWYYYIDTLSMSEIVGQSDNAKVDILINLFDFDTGITRHEMRQLSQKADGWNQRMSEIMRIQDESLRQAEQEKLVAEMMRDPAFKKIAQLLFKTGAKSAKGLLEILSLLKNFNLF